MMPREMEREDYAKMMSHFTFITRRKYEARKEYLIFAATTSEAEEMARKLFGDNSFSITKLTKTSNPLVYEI